MGERCLFSDLSFALNPGELLLLEGQNGCGKTSLMRAIAGLLEFESGEVYWDGNPVREFRQAFHGEMIWMAHRTGLKLDLTLVENLAFEDEHVRLQCERDLKAMLIGMRQGLLASSGRDKLLGRLDEDVADGLMRTVRGMLWLKGRKEALPASEAIEALEGAIDLQLPGLRRATSGGSGGWNEFRGLYADLDKLKQVVDAW